MLVLGIHGGEKLEDEDDPVGWVHHDGAAVLIRDGEVVAAIEEERLNRVKHSNCFPVRAIRYCLQQGECTLNDIDIIATNRSKFHADLKAKLSVVLDPRDKRPPDGRSHFASLFQRVFGIDVSEKVYFCPHHFAHAWSAFLCSGFERSLVFSVDGGGDDSSGMVMLGKDQQLNLIQEFKIPQSIGVLYQQLMRIVGYDRFDEYKVMGLAPYGCPDRFRGLFAQCYELLPEGNYNLESHIGWFNALDAAGLTAHARRKGDPFLQIHKDFAAALQEMTETLVMHIVRYYRETREEKRLCLAGGVAHNCSMNGKILYSGMFDEVFVQPAAHDAGGALGAAMAAWHENNPGVKTCRLGHVYWGTDIGNDTEIEDALQRWSGFVIFEQDSNITNTTATLLAGGAVVGWVQGRSEFGPRALGNRSILADPRPHENKLRINEMIKKREEYRPFAPSVLEERIGDFFEVLSGQKEYPFMSFALRVRESAQELLGATTHVDGTARVQSVSSATNPKYWELIREFERLTGVPILLNTSFNNNAEPIVDSIDEAVTCFLTTGIDYLVVGNHLARKKSPREIRKALLTTTPSIAPSRKLVRRTRAECSCRRGQSYFTIESAKSAYFGATSHAISRDMFNVLQAVNGLDDFETVMERAGVASEASDSLISEQMDLWCKRMIEVKPRAGAGK